jgi:membrane-bound lytic murein transglycosylase D
MFQKKLFTYLLFVSCFCLGGLTLSSCAVMKQDVWKNQPVAHQNPARMETAAPAPGAEPAPEPIPASARPFKESFSQSSSSNAGKEENPQPLSEKKINIQQPPPKNDTPAANIPETVAQNEAPLKSPDPAGCPPPALSAKPDEKAEAAIEDRPAQDPPKLNSADAQNGREEETEKDIMEEALVLLDESQKHWEKGEIEDAVEMLDQAYALLLDTNGNPDIARQKDDLRLLISKRLLAIYNSHQPTARGVRGEIPIVSNEDVEKEIRHFQTNERDFFISSYQRSMIYRPVIVQELKKAGLPEELSWLPLVESGFKISALSSARALGLWQFIPSTGYKYGLNRDEWIDERMDVEKSTRAAIEYFKDLHAMFGDWLTVLAGYNCGEGRVMRTIASQHVNYLDRFWDLYQRLPYETARYVPRFLATLLIVKDPQKYGMNLDSVECKPIALRYTEAEVNRCMRLQDIAQKIDASEETLGILNAELRHRMTPDRSYKLKVPPEKAEMLLSVVADIPLAEKPRLSSKTSRRGGLIRHKVRRGETLSSIARKYNTSVGAVRSANRLSKRGLVAGQRLNIPLGSYRSGSGASDKGVPSGKSGKGLRHKVQKGDTLFSISKKYDVSVSEIRRLNNLKGNSVKIGQTLRVSK